MEDNERAGRVDEYVHVLRTLLYRETNGNGDRTGKPDIDPHTDMVGERNEE